MTLPIHTAALHEPAIRDVGDLCRLLDIPFSDEQIAAITGPFDAPQAIIAGAGSGKTTVMAARVVWLVGHEGLDPDRVLGLTFTNKAAGELGQRIVKNLGGLPRVARDPEQPEPGQPVVSTYHAFAGQLISEFGLLLGIEPDLRVLADASRFQLAARAITTFEGTIEALSTYVPVIVADLLALEGQLAEHLVNPEQLRDFDRDLIAHLEPQEVVRGGLTKALKDDALKAAHRRIEISHLVDRYREVKAEAGVMDFSDQMRWGAELAAMPEVGADLRSRFDVVLLDEYQDTSVAQRDLLRALFSGPGPQQGRGHGVTAVGDPAQGIYGWRGAAATNLLEFLQDFPMADGTQGIQHTLNVTRRCAPEVIAVANQIAAPFYASTDAVTELQAAPENPSGTVSVALHETVADEIADLVERVQAVHEGTADAEGVPWHEIAVLVRATSENGTIVEALRSAGVPVEVVGLQGLLHQPEVRDVLSVLALLHDVTANPALLRLLTGPRWRIGPRDLALLGRRASRLGGRVRGSGSDAETADEALARELAEAVTGVDPVDVVSLLEAVEDPGDSLYSSEARERFAEVAALLRGLRKHLGEPLVDLARRVVTHMDLDVELMIRADRIGPDNISALLDAIAGYAEHDRYADLAGLLAYLDAEDEYAGGLEVASPTDSDAVKLLTAHRAKGLEYQAVFVPLASRTVFPNERGRPRWISSGAALPVELRGDAGSLADLAEWTGAASKEFIAQWRADARMEEHRLGYVAFTRAKSALHVSGHHWGPTQVERRGPSEFLTTVHGWLVDHGGAPTTWVSEADAADANPHLAEGVAYAWPAPLAGLQRRRDAAELVARIRDGRPFEAPAEPSTPDDDARGRLAEIDAELDVLLAEAAEAENPIREVSVPSVLSATATMALAGDESAYLRQLARPVPRQPSAAARLGTRLHAMIEAHYERFELFDPTDLPGQGDEGMVAEPELDELFETFLASDFAGQEPYALEAPFSIRLGNRQVIGRIDAVFETVLPDGSAGFEVVDWKTNRAATADPLQLAIYRLAWAEMYDLDPQQVTAAFAYIRLGQVHWVDDLSDRAGLEARFDLT